MMHVECTAGVHLRSATDRYAGGSSAPPLVCGLAGGAEPGGDLGPGVPDLAQPVHGGLHRGIQLGHQVNQLGQALDVPFGHAPAMSTDHSGGEGGQDAFDQGQPAMGDFEPAVVATRWRCPALAKGTPSLDLTRSSALRDAGRRGGSGPGVTGALFRSLKSGHRRPDARA
jgi:hypothetical protein